MSNDTNGQQIEVGDLVRIIGPSGGGRHADVGKSYTVARVDSDGDIYVPDSFDMGMGVYPPESVELLAKALTGDAEKLAKVSKSRDRLAAAMGRIRAKICRKDIPMSDPAKIADLTVEALGSIASHKALCRAHAKLTDAMRRTGEALGLEDPSRSDDVVEAAEQANRNHNKHGHRLRKLRQAMAITDPQSWADTIDAAIERIGGKAIKVGDRVRIVGPSVMRYRHRIGKTYPVNQITDTGNINIYDGDDGTGGTYYPPESVELVYPEAVGLGGMSDVAIDQQNAEREAAPPATPEAYPPTDMDVEPIALRRLSIRIEATDADGNDSASETITEHDRPTDYHPDDVADAIAGALVAI